jgi:spermidine/putrescine-binding protein
MWGTMGFVYNMETISMEDLNSWSVIAEPLLKNKVTIKDSVRDTYIMAVGAVYEEELENLKTTLDPLSKEYNVQLTEIFNRRDDETIEKVETFLQNARQNLYGFEVDSGKNDIVTGKIDVNFAWSGDAVAAIDEGDLAGATLGYAVPDEGSNVWFDGFVMTKNTQGQKEQDCIEFLNFICSPESAVLNMDYIGYTSVIAGQEVFDYVNECYTAESVIISSEEYSELDEEEQKEYGLLNGEYYSKIDEDLYGELVYDPQGVYLQTYKIENGVRIDDEVWEVYEVDLKYFFDPTATGDEYVIYSSELGRGLYAQYADAETINRCAIMDNFGPDDLARINAMWNRVKLITLSTTTIILIVSAIVVLVVLIIVLKYRNVIFKTSEKVPNRKARRIKKGYKIIKIQKL